ncbi:MAG: hypothetical protein ACE37F_00970 [Nannocystaceae bacterium]|nr:hypothetical protein [bacterium]
MDTDGPAETDDGPAESTALDMQAIMYSTWDESTQQGAVWLRRRGENPVLVDAASGERVGSICVHPDGAGYIVWSSLEGDELLRTQTFEVDHDSAQAGVQPSLPEGLAQVECPVGWGPKGAYVNLTQSADEPSATPMPHRLADGVAVPVEGALAPWEKAGRYGLERRALPEPDELWHETIVVWDLEPEVATPLTRWSSPQGMEVGVEGKWLVLTRRGEGTSVVPLAQPELAPIVLTEGPTAEANVRFSASGQYALVVMGGDGDTWVEILRITDGSIAARWVGAPFAEVGTIYGVSDRGVASLSRADSQLSFLISIDGESETVRPGEDHRFVGALPLDALDAALIVRSGGAGADENALLDAEANETPLPQLDDCEVFVVRRDAVFRCLDGSFGMLDLSNPTADTVSFAELAPTENAVGDAALELLWDDESWRELFFVDPDYGFLSVLVAPNGEETVALHHPGARIGHRALLPVSRE